MAWLPAFLTRASYGAHSAVLVGCEILRPPREQAGNHCMNLSDQFLHVGGHELASLDHDFSVRHRHVDIAAANRMDKVVVKVVVTTVHQRRHAGRVRSYRYDVSLLSGFQRADLAVESNAARPCDRAHA